MITHHLFFLLSIQHIGYAKTKSYATLRNEDPNFVPPTAVNASALISQNGKRPRDSDARGERLKKREKVDDSDEEMEIEDEEESPQKKDACTLCYFHIKPPFNLQAAASDPASVPSQVQQPTAKLLCQNLPQEVTDDVLAVLFQQ
jgi:U2 small nuclear ribonucleoprotein B''